MRTFLDLRWNAFGMGCVKTLTLMGNAEQA